MKIRTRQPNITAWQNPVPHARSMGKKLRQALGFDPKLDPRDIFELGVVLYEGKINGTDYQQIRDRWQNSKLLERFRKKASRPAVREALAEISAFYAVILRAKSQFSLSGRYIKTARQGFAEHLPAVNPASTLVMGVGNVGCEWLEFWPEQHSLTLIDNNPYIASFLEHCVAAYQKTDVTILEGDVFNLPAGRNHYNMIHVGNLLPYLTEKQLADFCGLLQRLFPSSPEERLLTLQETSELADPAWQVDFKPQLAAAGFEVIGESTRSLGQQACLTIFAR